MVTSDRELIAHLSRRAGFGATPIELEHYSSLGYENTVEEFLSGKPADSIPDDLIYRRHVDLHTTQGHNAAYWAYRLISTDQPLQEKVALFWHGIFATAELKLNNVGSLTNQIDMFRRCGIGKFDDLLLELSKDPAMLIWLDNHDNHKDEINENYGREILELFSMGVGNYSEDDIKECARAFTGWTVKNGEYLSLMGFKDSIWPYGRIQWHHEFRSNDHDNGKKTFLGETGNFNGSDIIEIICRQDSTANFIARHIYNYFVADEVPVPQWSETPPRNPEAIAFIAQSYFANDHQIGLVLKDLFNSSFFKDSLFMKVKSPAEVVIGTLRKTGEYSVPSGGEIGIFTVMEESGFMGQKLLDPPSVEGWHTGEEWITSGSLVERVNFITTHLGNDENPGVKDLIERVSDSCGEDLEAVNLVDKCVEVLGLNKITEDTKTELIEVAESALKLDRQDKQNSTHVSQKTILNIFKLIGSSREYQLC